MSQTYDCIVLGVGGFGSGAVYHLAKRGARVLGLEQFGIAHDRGSSHGETRIIRMAYFEHPDYVPLLRRAFVLWRELEAEAARPLFHQVGLFVAGTRMGEAVGGTLEAARIHKLSVEELLPVAACQRFPSFEFPDEFSVVHEPQAGYLEVEACVSAHVDAARRHGAVIHDRERVVSWSADGGSIQVVTDRDRYSAAALVVAAGPWSGSLLSSLGLPLTVLRKPLYWFPASPAHDVSSGGVTFFFDLPEGQFYGFPRIGGQVKVAEHTGGQPVSDPATVDRECRPGDWEAVSRFVSRYLRDVDPLPARSAVCLYTKTPDSHFIVDRHPHHPNVVFGAGFSGHGFKFTTVLGEALADLAMNGRTELPIGFLSLSRFS